jgi:uncharacterized membrane protein
MTLFQRRLSRLLGEAESARVIDANTSQRLLRIADEQEQSSGILNLAAVLGWLGGGVMGLGMILLIAVNWETIPDALKIVGFLAVFGGVHGAGLWLRARTNLTWFGEALNFTGAILFLSGIGLISQIFHIEGRAPNTIIIWLIAIVPLAWALRSAAITLLSVFALVLWVHMEQFSWAGHPWDVSPATMFLIDMGIGVALIGFSAAVRHREAMIALVLRSCGVLLLFFSVYVLGFYRHMSWHGDVDMASCAAPLAALLLGAAGLTCGYFVMLPENPRLRGQLTLLLGSLLAMGAAILSVEAGAIPRGPEVRIFDFGWYRHFDVAELALSGVAWAIWFLLAMWCVVFATRTGRKAYLNAGVLAVGLGVLTRFFDLAGSMMQTSVLFIVGGGALLATCFAVEFWRRQVLRTIRQTDALTHGVKS